MEKYRVLNAIRFSGDAILLMQNNEAYAVTTDFRTPYIRKKRRVKIPKDGILVWNWTKNVFQEINPKLVKKVIPMSTILNNKGVGDG